MEFDRSLAGTTLLQGLAAAKLSSLASRCRWQLFDKGQPVVDAEATGTEVIFVTAGRVRVTIYAPGGREITFRELGPGDSFGEISAIDEGNRSARVVAVEDSVVALMTRGNFLHLMRDHHVVAFRVMQSLASLVRDLTRRLVETTALTVPMRVRCELVRLSREAGIAANQARIVRFPVHADLATRISATREAVTRELNRLARRGLIERDGSAMLVLDLDGLQASIDAETEQ